MNSPEASRSKDDEIPRKLVEVAVALPVEGAFTYSIPAHLEKRIRVGARVLVPFGNRRVTGYVLGFPRSTRIPELKPVASVLDAEPLFGERDLELYRFVAGRYLAPLGEVIRCALPGGLSPSSRRMVSITDKGRRFMEDPDANPETAGLLQAVSRAGDRRLSRMQRGRGSAADGPAIRRLARLGLVSIQETMGGREASSLRRRWVEACGDVPREQADALVARAPRQAALLSELRSHGGMWRSELGGRGYDASILRRLLEKGLVRETVREEFRKPEVANDFAQAKPETLTQGQQEAVNTILARLGKREHGVFLLRGVTGSGKTEVYMRVIEKCLEQGRQAIVLVPEISLTPQLLGRFSARFGEKITAFHSHLSRGERYDQWRRILAGRVQVVVGARSAVFSPFSDPGVIVVDEEHETSYKQEDGVRYHAREVALEIGRRRGACVILGSATPSVEIRHRADAGEAVLLEMDQRIERRPLPQVEVVDMRKEEQSPSGVGGIFSLRLIEELEAAVSRGKQAILFLNRRGYASYVFCRVCGKPIRCENCSVTLTLHRRSRKLECHYCNYHVPVPEVCPSCGLASLQSMGTGTEKIEAEIQRLFESKVRVARMDRDTTARKGAHGRILSAFSRGEFDVLVGTQMVAKGHDFPNVVLVGVIDADTSLNLPDFRSAERTFQLLTQVSGRAGRGSDPGKVVIQSYHPEHYAIRRALTHDYEGFFQEERPFRMELGYPPAKDMILVRASGVREASVKNYLNALVVRAADAIGKKKEKFADIDILGPAPSVFRRLHGAYRWQAVLKGGDRETLCEFAKLLLKNPEVRTLKRGVSVALDVDPMGVL